MLRTARDVLVAFWERQSARRRRVLSGTGGVLLLVIGFVLGQTGIGLREPDHGGDRAQLLQEVETLRAEQRRLTAALARLQTDDQVNRQSWSRVEAQLGELQAQLIDQEEEVAFYRGVLGGDRRGAIRVQQFALAAAEAGQVELRFVLAHSQRLDREVRGQLQLRLEGLQKGRLVSLDMASLASSGAVPKDFSFRYFHEVSAQLRVPEGFTPERVVIRTIPSTGRLKAGVESFPWSVRGG